MKIDVKTYEKELKGLFCEIFSESSSFADLIFSEKLIFSHCFAIFESEKIVSFLYAIEKKFKVKSHIQNCIYIYGVGTVKTARNKGYMRSLLNEVYNYFMDKNTSFLYLVPAESSLFKMYEKFGFKTEFYLEREKVTLKKSAEIDIKAGDYTSDLTDFQNNFENVILLNESDIQITLGYTKYFKVNESGFLCEFRDKTAYIRESFIKSSEDLDKFLMYLGQNFNEAIITTSGTFTPYAMIKPYNNFSLTGSRYTNMNFD